MALADAATDNAAKDAVVWILIGITLLGVFLALINLRNIRLWIRSFTGARTVGAVTRIEVSTGPRGATRRPHVRFTTKDGDIVDGASALYRDRCHLAAGDTVQISYVRGNPKNITIRGYDFRLREPIGSVVSLAIAIAATVAAFNL